MVSVLDHSADTRQGLGEVTLLFVTREPHPSTRPDIQTLFGAELPKLGIRADLVAIGDPAAAWCGGRKYVEAAGGPISKRAAHLRLLFHMGELSCGAVDAVLARDRFFGAWVALRAARRARKPFFYWMSLPFPDAWAEIGATRDPARPGLGGWLHRLRWKLRGLVAGWFLYRHVLPHADHVFAQSDAMVEALVERGVPRAKLTAVPMGVDLDDMARITAGLDDPRLAGRRYLAYLGALDRTRQPEILIDALAELKEGFDDVLLVLVGDAQARADQEWLRSCIARSGVGERVIVTGWLAPERARMYVKGAAVALATYPRGPVHDLASPTKMAEYIALGVPVLANDQPDQKALLAAVGGGLCVSFTPHGLADGVGTMLADLPAFQAQAASASLLLPTHRAYSVLAERVARNIAAELRQAASQPSRRM